MTIPNLSLLAEYMDLSAAYTKSDNDYENLKMYLDSVKVARFYN